MLADIHAHLTDKAFASDLPAVLERAEKSGVRAIVCNGTNPGDNRKVLELAGKYSIVKAALGLYPLEILKMTDDEIQSELEFIRKNKDKIAAIGEIGLDNYWEKGRLERQRQWLIKIKQLAEKLDKPMIVHSRAAEEETIGLLKDSEVPVVMHAFGGKPNLARDAGRLYFSIPPNVVRSQQMQKLVETVPLTRILTETDAPYLGPNAKERNEPANVALAVKKIAEIKKIMEDEAGKILFDNFRKVIQWQA